MPLHVERTLEYKKQTTSTFVFGPRSDDRLLNCCGALYVSKAIFARDGDSAVVAPKELTLCIDVADEAYDLTPLDLLDREVMEASSAKRKIVKEKMARLSVLKRRRNEQKAKALLDNLPATLPDVT
jgi:hypothetical protein